MRGKEDQNRHHGDKSRADCAIRLRLTFPDLRDSIWNASRDRSDIGAHGVTNSNRGGGTAVVGSGNFSLAFPFAGVGIGLGNDEASGPTEN
jgi:hypothetical protein